MELYNAFHVHVVRVRHVGVVFVIRRKVVDGRLRFLDLFSGPANRHLVLLGRLRVLGQVLFLHGVNHLHDVRDDLATSISDLAVSQDQLLDTLLHQVQRRETCFWCRCSL